MRKIILLFLFLCISCSSNPEEQAAYNLAKRILPTKYKNVEFTQQKSDTNYYEMFSENGKLHIKADCSNSMAKALGDYLRDYCHTNISWFLCDSIAEPESFPATDCHINRKALVPNRFFFNYCTYAYTVGYWNWNQWERLIDWMAMNGITMALAQTGHESVWENVYRKFGLTDDEIRAYFSGPSTLPFNRMGNLDGWHGPLPQSWLDKQCELQKKIIEREKSLGISPILNSFTGHIPHDLAKKYPDADISELHWGKFTTWYLNPKDSLYSKILTTYHEEQEKLYGVPSHYYCVDLFNEMLPPSWDPDTLSNISKNTYESLKEVDPDAVWVQMSWMLLHHKWTPERLKAYLTVVPKHKLLMLDYAGDFLELYEKTKQFCGQDFLWCYLGNFGGHTVIGGNIVDAGKRIDSLYIKAPVNCTGIGCTLEGFGCNPEMYEFSLDRAWEKQCSTEEWLQKMADRHLGKIDDNNRKAWNTLRLELIDRREDDYWAEITIPPTLEIKNRHIALQNNKLMLRAWGELLEAQNTGTAAHNFDCVNFGRNCLDVYFSDLTHKVIDAYYEKDKEKVKQISAEMLEVLDDVDRLVAADNYFLLGRWIDQAKYWGDTPEEKEYYEFDAKNIVSTWAYNGCDLIDYACRDIQGLVGRYYKPRWEKWLSTIADCGPLDDKAFNDWAKDFEWNWVGEKVTYPSTPAGNGHEISKEIYNKYKDRINSLD